MVDLHPNGPGMPPEHRWLELSRWGLAWRVTLASLLVGMLGMTVLGLFGLLDRNSPSNMFLDPLVRSFAVVPAPIFGLLVACIGPWLRRFFPFTQGILFGLIGAVCVAAVTLCIAVSLTLAFGSCTPSNDCFSLQQLLMGALIVLMFAGMPLAIMAGLGLGIAILGSNNRAARRVFSVLLAFATVMFFVTPLVL